MKVISAWPRGQLRIVEQREVDLLANRGDIGLVEDSLVACRQRWHSSPRSGGRASM